MPIELPESLAFGLNFLHPLLMWVLLALCGYSMFLGIKAKKTRTAEPEERKQLIKGQYGKRHFSLGGLVLALMVLGTFGGMAVTYVNNGKLFVGPHLLVGIVMTSLIAIARRPVPVDAAGQPDRPQGPCGAEHDRDDPLSLAGGDRPCRSSTRFSTS